MVEVALEAALKDKQDMNQMPKAKNKEAGKEDSRKQQCSKCGSGASNSSSTWEQGDSEITQSHLDLQNGNPGSDEQSVQFEQVGQVIVRHT